MNKGVFLDRDGILNEEIGNYVYQVEAFRIVDGIIDVLRRLKEHGFLLIVVTNQAGIAKGLYTHREVNECHRYFQECSGHLIDKFYYAPGHPNYSDTLSRKPDSLLFEKAIAKYQLTTGQSWMVGDKERDIIPAKKLGIRTVRLLLTEEKTDADVVIRSVKELDEVILPDTKTKMF